MADIAILSLAGVISGFRPPLLPRALADANPALVRSEMSSRSNSASAAKMPKTSLPAAVVVSMAAPCVNRRPNLTPALPHLECYWTSSRQ